MTINRPLLLICLAELCMAMGMNLVNPILPLYAYSFNISYTMVGLIISSFGFTRIFIEIPGGMLTDRFGRKPIILLGNTLSLSSHLIAGFAQSPIELTISRMLMGVGSALSLTASMIFVLEIAPVEDKSRSLALFQSTFSIAGIVGPTFGGLISESWGLRPIFFISGVLSIVGMIIVLLMRRPRPQVDDEASTIQFNLAAILKDIKILILSCSSFMMFFLFSSIRSTMIPLYGSEYLDLNSFQIGLIFSFTSAIIVFGLLFLNARLEQIFERSILLSLSLILCSIAVFLIAFSIDFNTILLFSVPLGIGFSLLQPLPVAMLTDYSQPESRGLTIGFSRTIADLGIILGPTLVGWIIDRGQPILAFYLISAILSLFGFVIWYTFRKTQPS